MYGHQLSTAVRAAPAAHGAATGIGLQGKDFSSCWSALPSGIRQRIEPLLTASTDGGNGRCFPIAAARCCPA